MMGSTQLLLLLLITVYGRVDMKVVIFFFMMYLSYILIVFFQSRSHANSKQEVTPAPMALSTGQKASVFLEAAREMKFSHLRKHEFSIHNLN